MDSLFIRRDLLLHYCACACLQYLRFDIRQWLLFSVNKNMSCDSKSNAQTTSDYLSYYLTTNADSICRICLEKASKLVPIFDASKPPSFSILIMACASVQVNTNRIQPEFLKHKLIQDNVVIRFSHILLAFYYYTSFKWWIFQYHIHNVSEHKLKGCLFS